MRMKHKDKLKLARKMMTKEEIKAKVPPFECIGWSRNKTLKQLKQRTQELNKESK